MNRTYLIIIGVIMIGVLMELYLFTLDRPINVRESVSDFFQIDMPHIIDFSTWKVTLPVSSSTDSEKPKEVVQPGDYELPPWFERTPEGDGFIFRAPVNAPTTKNSKYPRSELREMTADGENASWSSKQGTHSMEIEQAITALPEKKRHVVASQIHDKKNDVIVIRLEYPVLYVNVDGKNVMKLDTDYTLGERFKVKYVVRDGKTDVFYNDNPSPAYTLKKSYKNAYFKVGAYTQSNCKTEKDASRCNDNNYGEVVVYKLKIEHD